MMLWTEALEASEVPEKWPGFECRGSQAQDLSGNLK